MVIGCQINYDNLGNPRIVLFGNNNVTEYIYAADGTKLRTIHRPAGLSTLTDSIDYIGNLILKNGQPSMYLFDGGYATFNANGAVNGWHYYIQDYMGNNRMVVNKNGTKEQVTHYYPYGGVIGDISTNESLQKYKFEGPRSHQKEIDNLLARRRAFRRGVELDRTFGLDNYDIHARQYFAMMQTWDRIDPLSEKYYGISPYAYCGGNPVNLGDYNGMDTLNFILKDGASDYASFSSRVTTNGNHIGIIKDSKGNVINQFSFINQEDAEMFKEEDDGGIALISKSEIESILSNIPDNLSLSSALEYAFKEGKNGTMVFMSQGNGPIQKKLKDMGKITLFLPQDGSNLAHDCWNYGNYLWGAGM